MRQFILSLFLIFGLCFPANADDYGIALNALKSGDFATALELWNRLAEQGNSKAQIKLGFMYEKGRGVQKDYKIAFEWYQRAALQGDGEAQHKVGTMYHEGHGVRQEYKAAVKWYALAAQQGDADAQTMLSYVYTNGHAVSQDFVYAYMWGTVAASNGGKFSRNLKELLEQKMTPLQVKQAQGLAASCKSKSFDQC